MSRAEQLKEQINQLLNTDATNSGQVINKGLTLRRLVDQAVQTGYGADIAQGYTSDQIGRLQEIHGRFEIATDHKFMDHVLSGKVDSPDEYPLQPVYNRLSAMEVQAAEMQRGNKVMHIGTGWPGTAIGLYRQFDIPVTCVEKDPEFAQRSEDGLKKLGLVGRDRLQVICADGTTLNTEGYQSVIISAMVPNQDKEKIIQNMRELAAGDFSDPVLVLRSPVDRARELFYQKLPDKISGYDVWLKRISDTADNVGLNDPLMSLVFRVKGIADARRHEDEVLHMARLRLHT